MKKASARRRFLAWASGIVIISPRETLGRSSTFTQSSAEKAIGGDFDFLQGKWKIKNRRLKSGTSDDWDEFEGEATCWSILNGLGSIEELRIPERNFSGMGLRLFDVEACVWQDFWVNAKSGILTTPGLQGRFENGEGVFVGDEKDGDRPMKVRGTWDKITDGSCRWRQAISYDHGKTWNENWIMHWSRLCYL